MREMLKTIMKRAHQLARQMEGDYAARLALGLRQAWREVRRMSKKLETITKTCYRGYGWIARITGRDDNTAWLASLSASGTLPGVGATSTESWSGLSSWKRGQFMSIAGV
jgi:hypothetical protein